MRPDHTWHRPMLACAGLMLVMSVASAVGLLVDDRLVAGAPAWLKPFKFAVSFTVYAFSWAWLVSLLRTRRRLVHTISTLVVVVILVEYAVITLQAARGTRSHFNVATPLDKALFSVMGVSITALWTGTLVLTLFLLRTRIDDAANRWGVRFGAVLSLIGLALGGLMVVPTPRQAATLGTDAFDGLIGAHSVGVPDGGPGLPLTGWSTVGGDLRIPHFVGMHALQALPLVVVILVLLSRRYARLRDDAVRGRLVIVAGLAYAGALALVTWQALRGQPLIAPDGLTLTALGGLVIATALGTVRALRPTASVPSSPPAHPVDQEAFSRP